MKRMKITTKIILSLFITFILIVGGIFSLTLYQLSKIDTIKISKIDKELGIKTDDSLEIKNGNGIINIAFFGVDRRDKNEASRSDSIMILSIDEKHKKIKMSSIMRDTYVKIDNHGQTKINHAYAYGGPQLAIRTINENFNLDIRDYVTVDFFNFESIIDSMGGVTIDVKQNELSLINANMQGVASIEKKAIISITKSGPQTLNGLQAVAYTRIRYTTGGDFVRTERQRTVMSAIFTKIQSLGVDKFPSVVSKLIEYTETSMNSIDIMKIGTKAFVSNIKTLEQERFPLDGYCSGKIIDGVWYLVADIKSTEDQMYKFIYEDIKPISKAPLF